MLILFLAGQLIACSSELIQFYQQGDSGYRLTLNKPLTISPGQARVFLQEGRAFASGLDEYQPHCSFEVRHLSDSPQIIHADTFVVSRIQTLIEEVVQYQPVMLAALGSLTLGADIDSSPSDIFRGYHFWLRSDHQPNVLRMTCRGALAPPWDAYPPTHAEIEYAISHIATLELQGKTIVPGHY